MKLSVVSLFVLASMSLSAPLVQASESEVLQACLKSFVAENFANQKTTIRIDGDNAFPLPLVMRRNDMQVRLIASSKATGRQLAVATCGRKDGVVTILSLQPSATMAAR